MKNATYMGQTFSVPDEAKFIAADPDGEVIVFDYPPKLDYDGEWMPEDNISWWKSVGFVKITSFHFHCEAC